MLNYFIFDVKNRFKEQIQRRPTQSITEGSSSTQRDAKMRYGSISGKSCTIGGEPFESMHIQKKEFTRSVVPVFENKKLSSIRKHHKYYS